MKQKALVVMDRHNERTAYIVSVLLEVEALTYIYPSIMRKTRLAEALEGE